MSWFRQWFGWQPKGHGRKGLSPFEYYGSVSELPVGVVFGAGFAPGFAGDRTCWRLWFYPDGRVVQQLRLWAPENNYPVERRRVLPVVVAGLVAAADASSLGDLATRYDSDWTDLCLLSVAARLAGGVKAVAVYGPHALASEGHAGAATVLRLWEMAARHAPRRPEWLAAPDSEAGDSANG